MFNSVYIHVWEPEPLKHIKKECVDNNVDTDLLKELIGEKQSNLIFRDRFRETESGGILIEIPGADDLKDFLKNLRKYIKDTAPDKVRVLTHSAAVNIAKKENE